MVETSAISCWIPPFFFLKDLPELSTVSYIFHTA